MESKEIGSCKFCGLPFKKTTPPQVFCSVNCKKSYSYYTPKEKIKKTCPKCGKEFFAQPNQKFCSFKCKLQFNEKKFRERTFVAKQREEIWKILPKNCKNCGKEANEIHHKTYNIPIRKINYNKSKKYNKVTLKDVQNMLKEYCKYLEPLCSNCHKNIHKNN